MSLFLSSFSRLVLVFFAALISIIFVLMVASYPLGTYVIFNTELGSTITHEFPLQEFFLFAVLPVGIPATFQLGELFIMMWCFYLLFFALLMFGPRRNVLQSWLSMIRKGEEPKGNALNMVIVWLAAFFVISRVLDLLQESVGVSTGAIEFENQLVQFFNLTAAPIREELGFRLVLVGIPAYFILVGRRSFSSFFGTLWHPGRHRVIDGSNRKQVYILITISAVLFGLAHVFFGEGWSYGKISQAMVGGWILGWVYYRYGLHAAIIMHWGINYFIFSYAYFGNTVWGFSWNDPAANPMLAGIDYLLTVTGTIAIVIFLYKFFRERFPVRSEQQNSF
ncbi:MAG: CPBP family intramembrane glutamic endopeptidase, partial [Nitrososphaerales archaeon]